MHLFLLFLWLFLAGTAGALMRFIFIWANSTGQFVVNNSTRQFVVAEVIVLVVAFVLFKLGLTQWYFWIISAAAGFLSKYLAEKGNAIKG